MIVRRLDFQLIINPDFLEQKDELGIIINEVERYITAPAFEYFKKKCLT